MRFRRAEEWRLRRRIDGIGVRRRLTWPTALLLGSVLGLGLRLILFLVATFVVRSLANAAGALLPLLPAVDPVYSHAAVRSLGDIQVQGLAIGGPLGRELHALMPALVVDPVRAHFALVRLAVQPGSALIARLVAAGLTHATLLGIGMWIVKAGWSRRSIPRVFVGVALQAQVAVGILGAPPSVRELEATGVVVRRECAGALDVAAWAGAHRWPVWLCLRRCWVACWSVWRSSSRTCRQACSSCSRPAHAR